ncbi:hypothetical protein CgunFtcFv8_019335 [Champsocephalus gunnari]|uniref:Uncharacterized protein n=1 Tax=Champsocephalus gunnari TaxID=52237 RepID=A0AAN8HS23_CHAGU|nr:hypothetical protein CgunFtcFv8_019335 [Champsocephalus gunnari]
MGGKCSPTDRPPITAARWLHCLDDKSVTVKQVPIQPTGGQCGANRGASTLNNSSSAYRAGAALWVVCSSD